MPTADEKGEIKAPVTQKNPPNTGTTNKTVDPNAPKLESTGMTKTPSGTQAKAGESVNKTGVVTGDKSGDSKKSENLEPLEKSFSSIEGEILQGDSFRITLKRGNKTIRIPVPIEGANNVIVLDNTFRIIKAVLEAKTEKELNEKFAAFVE